MCARLARSPNKNEVRIMIEQHNEPEIYETRCGALEIDDGIIQCDVFLDDDNEDFDSIRPLMQKLLDLAYARDYDFSVDHEFDKLKNYADVGYCIEDKLDNEDKQNVFIRTDLRVTIYHRITEEKFVSLKRENSRPNE
jgi:hypothetical protein